MHLLGHTVLCLIVFSQLAECTDTESDMQLWNLLTVYCRDKICSIEVPGSNIWGHTVMGRNGQACLLGQAWRAWATWAVAVPQTQRLCCWGRLPPAHLTATVRGRQI